MENAIEWSNRVTVDSVRQIAHCKRCKVTKARTITRTITRAYRSDQIGEVGRSTKETGATAALCTCNRPMGFKDVQGKYSEKHKCGAKCMGSRGPSCECSCGGKNHGASYNI